MGLFLNSVAVWDRYKTAAEDRYFIDKTGILEELIPLLCREQRFVCITRPRRFGKTIMANMVGAFFEKGTDGRQIFDRLEIANSAEYEKHINAHNVMYIDFSEKPELCTSYEQYISRIIRGIKQDLKVEYEKKERTAGFTFDDGRALWDILSELFEKTGEKFIFVIDEWDAIFTMPFITEKDKREYLQFLKLLLKGKSYVELAYMTGVLPIAKYSSGSELNMFLEYDMATKIKYGKYFGFSGDEVDVLYKKYTADTKKIRIRREDLGEWYDGYYTAEGERLYNPRSVVCALSDNQLSSYWVSSGPYDEIFTYIRHNVEKIRDDLALMVMGEGVDAKLGDFAASSMELKTKNQIYSAMVIYGLLTYNEGQVWIPNRELMMKYSELLQREPSLGYVHRLAVKSEQMLKATLRGDTDTMAKIMEYAHDTEVPILSYNQETELAAIVNLVYLAARDRYHMEREDKAGKGFVDFIFYPVRPKDDALILELKVDHTPEEAISQIKEKNYSLRFSGKLAEEPKYTGRVLAVGIGYNKKDKKHSCKVEVIS